MSRHPIEAIVTRFGGQNVMARTLGCSQPTVWCWAKNGSLPARHIERIIEAGRLMDPPIDLEPNDFFPVRYRKIPPRYRKRVRTP
jgi:DNA-binding transcriptional regulator YdaS (Cro superfamily)